MWYCERQFCKSGKKQWEKPLLVRKESRPFQNFYSLVQMLNLVFVYEKGMGACFVPRDELQRRGIEMNKDNEKM